MDTIPAEMSDILQPLIFFAAWAAGLGLTVARAPKWLIYLLCLPFLLLFGWNLLALWNAAPALHWYVPRRIGRPASTLLDLGAFGLIILFFAYLARRGPTEQR
ncbi:MAG TPA: hypothetical protein VGF77_01110 [Allosphingosinicella sp.]|jgi:hypothetical protein